MLRGRTGGQGTAVEQSINPKCRSLRKWALLKDAVTALQSSGWCTPVHSILSPSLVNKKFALLDSPHSSFSQKTPVRRQLPWQAPSAALQPTTCPWLCHMPKLHASRLDSQSGASFNVVVLFLLSLQWSPIERSLAVVPTACQRSLCKNSHFKRLKVLDFHWRARRITWGCYSDSYLFKVFLSQLGLCCWVVSHW